LKTFQFVTLEEVEDNFQPKHETFSSYLGMLLSLRTNKNRELKLEFTSLH
jgi:hypothetical protein